MGVWGRTVLLGAAAAYAVWYLFLKSDDEGEVDQAKESGATTGVMRVDATDASGNSLRSEAQATYCQFDYYSFEVNHCVSHTHSDCDVQSTGLYQSPDNLYPPIPEQFGQRLSKSLPPRRSPISRAHSQNIGVPPQKSTPLGYPSPTSHCCLPPIGGSDTDTDFGHEVFEHEPSNPADAWARIPDEAATYRESARIAREMAASLPKHSTRANELRKLRKKHNVKACQIIFDHNNRNLPPGTIDLHNLYIDEALEKVDLSIRQAKGKRRQISFITGKGRHSADQRSTLKPRVTSHIKRQWTYSVQEDPCNAGRVIVSLV